MWRKYTATKYSSSLFSFFLFPVLHIEGISGTGIVYLFIGAVVILAIIMYIVFRLINQNAKRKIATSNQISNLKIQALNSAINSHFIYNVLSAIQYFIKSNQLEPATQFLSYFAKLIRITVDNSDRSFIRLTEELDRIRLYLELEKLRMSGKLSYRIVVEGFTNDTVLIPNMLIMPFIENAILHGIIPANRAGNIEVSVTVTDPVLAIVIEDDGIGIRNSRAANTTVKQNKRSVGTENVRRRLEIFSGEDHVFEIIDKSEAGEESTGTRVRIIVPLKYMVPGEDLLND